MINIRPVSDLRNKFPEVEETVITTNSPVFLTKNGYGTMVLMSIEQYSALTDPIEYALDEADSAAKESKIRYSGADVFRRIRERVKIKRSYKTRCYSFFLVLSLGMIHREGELFFFFMMWSLSTHFGCELLARHRAFLCCWIRSVF